MYQDGVGTILRCDWDVQSLTACYLDTDGDGTYEVTTDPTTAPVDFFQYPLNETPKTKFEVNPNGDIGAFAAGIQRGVQITGLFGYGAGFF